MPAGRQRTSANAPDKATVSTNERILKECHDLYIDKEKGLVAIAKELDLSLLSPRKKITVLLIGNHSAGKSSFVNWYVEEHVQKTGVAIETQGFTFVTSGRKRESLTGQATLHLYPHFKELETFPGVVEYLSTEISTSKQKKFSLVTFVDTPGLVDGDMKYPFDVEQAIFWLGNTADLIFVFFDPIGQALCKRTLNIVEKLNEKQADRIRFYLSKADTAGHESDRQRVLMQITQELCKRPGLNKAGFDMQTIFVPSLIDKPARCANQIEEVCKQIEKTINQAIQSTLNTLEKDCQNISSLIDGKLKEDRENRSYNIKARMKSYFFMSLGLIMPFAMFISFITHQSQTLKLFGKDIVDTLHIYTGPVEKVWSSVPSQYSNHFLVVMIFLSLILTIMAKFSGRLKQTLSRKQQRLLSEKKLFVQTVVHPKRERLYKEYLQQSVAEHDL
ncbi:EH domain-containing protein 1-like [Xenia sp. Carnegie-2017]|uniref:EH domain-containing protein 1-like n=1 Tax=Xenia sp. Carnegie-2017 TaxID=2897299 RepID=UPI001F043FEC|nr:EH domain-containing protein 1-like [Xenia sp. Carnegie-2017]